ncbi:MAG TPA: FMN-binding negative transcriptional regulator [Puia sp.]|nr:FMN-binding negative transcriptional regulator [Puia sp.]
MHIPKRYEERDPGKIRAFIRDNSFAILVSVRDGSPVATHIPLLMEKDAEERDILVGHISKGNEQKDTLVTGAKVLAIFPGPHAYVSPRWYTKINVPTWNYISVHVYGTLTLLEGDALRAALNRLVHNYERHLPRPVHVDEIPPKELEADYRGVVGFQILVEEVQAAYKLSQNRDEGSYRQVIGELEKGDEMAKAVAMEMRNRKDTLFSPGSGEIGSLFPEVKGDEKDHGG